MVKEECFIYCNEPGEGIEDFVDRVYQSINYADISVINFEGKLVLFNPCMSKDYLIINLLF